MSDETNASQDEFDEELTRAAAEVAEETEEVVEETEEVVAAEEEVPAEPVDNKERSRMGRKQKALEEQVQTLQQQLEQLTSKMTTPEVETDPDDLATVADVERILSERETEKTTEQLRYQTEYMTAFIALDQDGAVEDEMMANFNKVHTGDAKVDAKINYLEAKTSLLSQGKKVNLKGDTPPGINTGTKVTSPKKKEKPLSDEAKKFLKREGLDSSWAQGKLSA